MDLFIELVSPGIELLRVLELAKRHFIVNNIKTRHIDICVAGDLFDFHVDVLLLLFLSLKSLR